MSEAEEKKPAFRLFTSEAKGLLIKAVDKDGKKKDFRFVNGQLRVEPEDFDTIDRALVNMGSGRQFVVEHDFAQAEAIARAHMESLREQASKGGTHSLSLSGSAATLAARDAELAKQGVSDPAGLMKQIGTEILTTEQAAARQVSSGQDSAKPPVSQDALAALLAKK